MIKNKKYFVVTIFSFLILVLLFLLCLIGTSYAKESNITYSNVLDDLKKDSSFKESFYPVVSDDYSLKLIQIAESVNGELFLYVYQPSGQTKNLNASSINISITVNDEISFHNYKIKLLNSSGVFFKYVVTDFVILSEPTRYYAISSIYRFFDATIDTQAGNDNKITEVNYAVNKQYCFGTINGIPYCNVIDIETIVITDKFVGFVRYSDGFKLYVGACDSHFVAFDTDKPIDKLLEADLFYTTQEYSRVFAMGVGERETFGVKTDKYAYLKYTDKVEHTGDGWLAGTYKWDRIETVEQFIAENDLTQNVYSGAIIDVHIANKITDEGKAALKNKKWVLRFAETSYSLSSGVGSNSTYTTLVGDVTILRLKFETDGVTYNLGVIDNKQTGSDKPSNEEKVQVKIKDNIKLLLLILFLILLLLLLAPFLPVIFSLIIKVISIPFKIIGAIFKSFKKDKQKGVNEYGKIRQKKKFK